MRHLSLRPAYGILPKFRCGSSHDLGRAHRPQHPEDEANLWHRPRLPAISSPSVHACKCSCDLVSIQVERALQHHIDLRARI